MAYRLHASETVARGLRRVVRQEIDRALAELTDKRLDPHEAVHAARKHFKKVRAALRLARSELGERFPFENAWWRDQGHDLARVRDATTQIESLDALVARFPRCNNQTPAGPVRQWLIERRRAIAAEQGDLQRELRALAARLRRARQRVAAWPLSRMGFDALAAGLRKCYAQGRRALRRLDREPTAENFHELRKRTKDHGYHSHLLEPLWPSRGKSHQQTLGKLADLLGDDHDLTILRQTLLEGAEALGGPARLRVLLDLIGERQAELRKEARAVADPVYAEKPGALLKRLEADWRRMTNKG
jgi:CHAD domain-containing protein